MRPATLPVQLWHDAAADRGAAGIPASITLEKIDMTLRELLDQVKDLPPDTLVCTAELDEAFGVNPAGVEIVDSARIGSREANGGEAVELSNGSDKVVVIRW